jgi:hypothetical protein
VPTAVFGATYFGGDLDLAGPVIPPTVFFVPPTLAEAVQEGNQIHAFKCEVRNGGELVQDITNIIQVGGSMSCDATRQVRRTCTFTVPGEEYLPGVVGDLFHPISNNELFPFLGRKFRDGSISWWPLGVFRMTTPAPSDDGTTLITTINGLDRSSVITQKGAYDDPWVIIGGTPVNIAIQMLIDDVYPGLTYNLAPSKFILNTLALGSDPGTQADRWADVVKLAAQDGCELFFDENGTVTKRPVVDGTNLPVTIEFVAGDTCTVNKADRKFDEAQTFSGVRYVGNGPGGAPGWQPLAAYGWPMPGAVVQPSKPNGLFYRVQSYSGFGGSGLYEPTWPLTTGATVVEGVITWVCAGAVPSTAPVRFTVWNTNPDASTFYLGPFGKRLKCMSTSLVPGAGQSAADAQNQIKIMAIAELFHCCHDLDDLSVTVIPGPYNEGDIAQVTHARMKIDFSYMIQAFTTPFDPGSLMTITFAPRLQLDA